jgi:hypothetical protein
VLLLLTTTAVYNNRQAEDRVAADEQRRAVLSSEARTAQVCSWLGVAVTLAVAAAACGTRAGGWSLASRLADR